MAQFNLDNYLARLGNNPVPSSMNDTILAALGLSGLSYKTKANNQEVVREMYDRLVARFPQMQHDPTRPSWRAQGVTLNGQKVSIATLVLIEQGRLQLELDRFTPRVLTAYADIIALGEVGSAFVDLVYELEIYPPPDALRGPIVRWLQRAVTGEESGIFMAVCPDYSHEDGHYTFSALWCGVGLVARRGLAAVPKLHQFIQRFNLPVQITLGMADFEADCEKNRRCVGGISKDEFVRRLRESQEMLRAEIERMVPGLEHAIRVPFITELAGGQEAWKQIFNQAQEAVTRGNITGSFPLSAEELDHICRMRAAMNAKWADPNETDFDPMRALLQQAPDYGAVGGVVFRILARERNMLMIGLDSVAMSPFLHMLLPECGAVAYMKRVDY